MPSVLRSLVALCAALNVSACGTYLPKFDQSYTSSDDLQRLVAKVAGKIDCELKDAVLSIAHEQHDVLATWAALITLTLTVDEKTIANPNVTLTNLLPGYVRTFSNGTVSKGDQSFAATLGLSGTADAQRVVKLEWFIDFDKYIAPDASAEFLSRPYAPRLCPPDGPRLIEGDLGIKEGLESGMLVKEFQPLRSDPFKTGGPLQVVQYQVTFDLSYSGSVTPTWKFVDVAANTTAPFVSGSRDRKDDLIIAMGPTQLSESKRPLKGGKPARSSSPSTELLFSSLAAQFGLSVSNALRAQP